MAAYYNEIEPYAAEWLRNLIKAGHIPHGEVDTRSIVDVRPADLAGFTQCHFFAGIGGWGHALRLAGWPDDKPIWTGSCPCQPFSVAGKGAGTDDPRHLWPHFHRLIAACRPPVVMGEQVAGAAGYGWLDGVRADLARENYASRGVDIPACSVDAPHIRQRLYWVASDMANTSHHRAGGDVGALGDGGRSTLDTGPESLRQTHGQGGAGGSDARSSSHMAHAGRGIERKRGYTHEVRLKRDSTQGPTNSACRSSGDDSDMADARYDESQGWIAGQDTSAGASAGNSTWNEPASCRISHGDSHMADLHQGRQLDTIDSGERTEGMGSSQSSRDSRFWSDHIWLTGSDGKARRSQPGLPLLAHGLSNRVGRLRAYGNAIVPQVAAEVIRAFIEATEAA